MDPTKYRNSNGFGYTKALFQEFSTDPSKILYTLKDQDTEYPSLYRLYMQEADPTEYRVAVKYFDGWSHWEDLCLLPWFKSNVERWRRELEVKIRSEALARIVAQASSDNLKTKIPANKYLLSNEWMPKEARKAGRPTKEQIQKETKRLADIEKQIGEDLERLK